MNRLANEKSAYLQHAAHQKIDWHPWSEEAFELARHEDKPVFLSTGAVWCHWCHVMAKESFEDEETARILNEHFIAIKLDRDERPDIDRRYQQAVAAMGSGGGWPLSVFLTPDKRPFYGGTYFPPKDLQGRPGFKNVLRSVSSFYKTKREEINNYSQRVMEAIKPEALYPSDLGEAMIDEAEKAMLALSDTRNGGFGNAPKFPMPGALEFLIRRAARNGGSSAGDAARRTLVAMAAGGFHDHLGGGFHRYSVDEAWRIPHFEKMADDNAGLLRNYVDGYAVFGDVRFLDVARGILAFTREVLSDPRGGFFASQDADVTPDDEGGYFIWTEDEFRKALDPEEYALLSSYLLHEQGSMHHDPAKKVLFTTRSIEEIATGLGKNVQDMDRIIQAGQKKLLNARQKRETPFIDKTLYTSLNGMLISAYFHAFAVLGDEEVREFAVKSLERVLAEREEPLLRVEVERGLGRGERAARPGRMGEVRRPDPPEVRDERLSAADERARPSAGNQRAVHGGHSYRHASPAHRAGRRQRDDALCESAADRDQIGGGTAANRGRASHRRAGRAINPAGGF